MHPSRPNYRTVQRPPAGRFTLSSFAALRGKAAASRAAVLISRAVCESLERRLLLTTNYWNNAAGGDWDTAGNWSLNHVPFPAEDVMITLPGNYTVTHSVADNDSVNSITSDQPITLSAGSLNVATTVQLNTNSLTFAGGTLMQATVNESAGAELLATSSGGALSGVTVNGVLDLSQQPNANVTIYNGLVLNGILMLGNDIGSIPGQIYFGDSTHAAGSLTGNGAVLFGNAGSNFIGNNSGLPGAAGTLTFGPGITLQGTAGYIYNSTSNGSIVNQGTIDANGPGGLIYYGYTIGALGNQGTLEAANGGTLSIYATWSNSGTIIVSGESSVTATGFTQSAGSTLVNGILSVTGLPFNILGGSVNVNNLLTINYGAGADPITAIQTDLASGYNHGAWNGTGIISSDAANYAGSSLGYTDGDTDGTVAGAGPNEIVIKYTMAADANLDGIVNSADLLAVVQNFNKTGTDWVQANSTYVTSGLSTTSADLLLVVQNFNKTISVPTTMTLGVSSASATIGQSVTLTATVTPSRSGTPTGTVTFVANGTTLGAAAVNSAGVATFIESSLYTGVYSLTATYSGDSTFDASNGANTLTINLPASLSTTADGLQLATVTAGSGSAAQNGQYVEVNYTGYLYDPGKPDDGTEFDRSLNPGRTPFYFYLGEATVIQGWEEGIPGMLPGEVRLLIIPSALAYGSSGAGSIPPNATLLFIVQMLAVAAPRLSVTNIDNGNNPVPVMVNQPPSAAAGTDFGSTTTGTAGATTTFALNLDDPTFTTLSLTGSPFVQISGSGAASFILTQPTTSNGFVFTITFDPAAMGTQTATITIFNNDPNAPNFSFNVTGRGT